MVFQRILIEKLPFLLVNTVLLYPPLSPYGPTDSTQIHLLRMGWRNFLFQLCHCVSFLVVGENSFWCYLLVVPLCQFFGCGRK